MSDPIIGHAVFYPTAQEVKGKFLESRIIQLEAELTRLREGLTALSRSTDYTADQLRAAAASILKT